MSQDSPKTIRSFTDLEAWKEAHKLVILIYRITERFPSKEQFGLTNQIRRAVISITSNIAEGFSRRTYPDRLRFYEIALGSLTEVQNQLLAARDIGFLEPQSFQKLADQSVTTHKLLNGLIRKSRAFAKG